MVGVSLWRTESGSRAAPEGRATPWDPQRSGGLDAGVSQVVHGPPFHWSRSGAGGRGGCCLPSWLERCSSLLSVAGTPVHSCGFFPSFLVLLDLWTRQTSEALPGSRWSAPRTNDLGPGGALLQTERPRGPVVFSGTLRRMPCLISVLGLLAPAT